MSSEHLKSLGQELAELLRSHLPASHCKLAMLRGAVSRCMAVYFHSIRRVCQDHICALAIEERGKGCFEEGISAEDAAIAEGPEVAELADCRACLRGIDRVLFVGSFASLLQNQIDLRHLKARDRNIEISLDGQKALQFDRKDRLVPLSVQSKLVIGN